MPNFETSIFDCEWFFEAKSWFSIRNTSTICIIFRKYFFKEERSVINSHVYRNLLKIIMKFYDKLTDGLDILNSTFSFLVILDFMEHNEVLNLNSHRSFCTRHFACTWTWWYFIQFFTMLCRTNLCLWQPFWCMLLGAYSAQCWFSSLQFTVQSNVLMRWGWL